MITLASVTQRVSQNAQLSLNKFVQIKKYLPTVEKFNFFKEFEQIISEHLNDYPGHESFIAFIFFHLLFIKYYTNIQLELTYDDFDALQEYGIIDKVINIVGDDYTLINQLIQNI
jgi:hypothetical protein